MTHVEGTDVLEELKAQPRIQGLRKVTVELDPTDTAWDPSSTKRVLTGPAVWTYIQYTDGGVSVHREYCNANAVVGETRAPCGENAVGLVNGPLGLSMTVCVTHLEVWNENHG